ncbi:hypothetical protein GCM10010327_26090 [Streptomyces nitrosporeus]|nr:hypothetical protein GCM10010327_26090 [Streptomyces nitrosporeus]
MSGFFVKAVDRVTRMSWYGVDDRVAVELLPGRGPDVVGQYVHRSEYGEDGGPVPVFDMAIAFWQSGGGAAQGPGAVP